MTSAIPMTPADVEYHKARVPPALVDEMIADGTFVIVEKECGNNGNNLKK